METRQSESDAGKSNQIRLRSSVNHPQLNNRKSAFKANPFPLLANLRVSQPVFRTDLPDKTPVWLLTRYEGIPTLLRAERFVKEKTTMGLVLPSTATNAQ